MFKFHLINNQKLVILPYLLYKTIFKNIPLYSQRNVLINSQLRIKGDIASDIIFVIENCNKYKNKPSTDQFYLWQYFTRSLQLSKKE